MYVVEEAVGPNGKGHAVMIMEDDGSFAGLVYQGEGMYGHLVETLERQPQDYKVCAQGETLSVVRTLVYEELGII